MVDEAGTKQEGTTEQEGTAGLENEEKTVLTEKTDAEAGEKSKAEVKAAKEAEAKGPKDAEDGDKGTDGAPTEYADFTVPEGMEVDGSALEAFAPVAKELNLTQKQAQKVVDLQSAFVQKNIEAQQVAWAKTQEDWRAAVKADTEVGGDAMDEKVALAKKALDKVGTPELRALLDATGTGNNLEFIRFFARVGGIIGDDTMDFGGASSEGPTDPAKILFPDQN